MLLYAEGTRFTPEKSEASQKFAREKNLPVLKHHLTPRTRGFTASIPHLREKVGAIYDIQLAFKSDEPVKPTVMSLLAGKSLIGHMYAKRIPFDQVPEDEEEAAKWLHELYQQKVCLLLRFYVIQLSLHLIFFSFEVCNTFNITIFIDFSYCLEPYEFYL